MQLTIKQKVFSLRERFTVTDTEGAGVYEVAGKILSIGHKLTVSDMDGNEAAEIKQKVVSLKPSFEFNIGGEECELHGHFTLFKPHYTLNTPLGDWEITGDFTGHEYEMKQGGITVATVSQRWFSWGDTYMLDVLNDENTLKALCVMLAIDCVDSDTAAAAASSSVQ